MKLIYYGMQVHSATESADILGEYIATGCGIAINPEEALDDVYEGQQSEIDCTKCDASL